MATNINYQSFYGFGNFGFKALKPDLVFLWVLAIFLIFELVSEFKSKSLMSYFENDIYESFKLLALSASEKPNFFCAPSL